MVEGVSVWIALLFCVEMCVMASPHQRLGHSAVTTTNGTILVYGGYNYLSTDYPAKTYHSLLSDIWAFDPAIRNWTEVLPASNSTPPARWFHTAALRRRDGAETMVIFGGVSYLRYDGQRSTTFASCGRSDVWEFNLNTLEWIQLQEDRAECADATRGVKVGLGLVLFCLLSVSYWF
eukprot:TRINITY_DN4242_c0_g1_i1.p1 TRINITY_DN4242_c0_g1~~TRINITY_DN4242_c0_g1_i1.p1  ORF type:complete len:177 (-),score=17.81 TRINITY_DN4242_c0_g1_i1:25-555(-)